LLDRFLIQITIQAELVIDFGEHSIRRRIELGAEQQQILRKAQHEGTLVRIELGTDRLEAFFINRQFDDGRGHFHKNSPRIVFITSNVMIQKVAFFDVAFDRQTCRNSQPQVPILAD